MATINDAYGGGGLSIKNGELLKEIGYVKNRELVKYKDTLLKADFYRGRIIKNLTKYGEILSDKSIQDRLDDIDLYQPIFKSEKVKSGEKFDVSKYNYDMQEIHEDLKCLYDLLKDLTVVQFDEIKNFLDVHITEMEMEGKRYASRIELEVNSSKLGFSVFHKDGPFPWFTRDNYVFTELGEATLSEGSILGLVVAGENVTHDNIMVGFELGGDIKYITPYNYMNDVFQVPGEHQVNQYRTAIEKDTVINRSFDLKIQKEEGFDQSNSYVAYAGEGLIKARQDSVEKLIEQSDTYDYYVEGNWNVSFYIKNATYARFEFSKEIENKSFSGVEIIDIKEVQNVSMKDSGSFAFKVYTDGQIYCERKICYVRDGQLYYPTTTLARDFLVEEMVKGKDINVNLFLRIKSDRLEYPEINSIAIKELIEEDILDDLL